MSVLMGANVANEVAKGDFAEATIGAPNAEEGAKWCKLFNTPDFSVTSVPDVAGAELCGALKNVVALGAGFSDGLGFGGNTKAAIIRIGLKEMQKFCSEFYGDRKILQDTFLESCGVADLVTTCFGGTRREAQAGGRGEGGGRGDGMLHGGLASARGAKRGQSSRGGGALPCPWLAASECWLDRPSKCWLDRPLWSAWPD